jgi:hypothetical protein
LIFTSEKLLSAQAERPRVQPTSGWPLCGNARDAGKILAEAAGALDFSKPMAVMMLGLLHFIPDSDDPYSLTARYLDAVPSGSYLAVSHASSDIKVDTHQH